MIKNSLLTQNQSHSRYIGQKSIAYASLL